MTEPIVLTDDEIEALEFEIVVRTPMNGSHIAKLILRAVINKLNELRAPLPLGTVRATKGGLAVKAFDDAYIKPWRVYHFDGRTGGLHFSDEYVADWPIVYKPIE